MMSEPNWEALDRDCLVSIFGRVGLESLLLAVPFVCKSWYKATLIPQSWRHLDFSVLIYDDDSRYDVDFPSRLMGTYRVKGDFPITAFIKSAVKRSDRSATYIALPELSDRCMEEALLYVADECPALKTLVLPSNVLHGREFKIENHMSNWTNLQSLKLQKCFDMQELLTQISIHCKSFVALAIESANIGKDEASAIVNSLPNIKVLHLRYASMTKENLMTILQGCKQLELFDARNCIGFNEGDEEILKHASHIQSFKCEGSVLWHYCHYYGVQRSDRCVVM